MNISMLNKIKEKFGKGILKRSAMNLVNGFEDLEYFMKLKPINIAVEIGTFRGITSAIMSQYCKKLYTIDLFDGQIEKNRDKWGNDPKREEIWNALGIKNIVYCPVESNKDKFKFLRSINFNFCFIDGEHSYDGVKRDFEYTKHCSNVLFHDYDDSGRQKRNDVFNFVNTLPKQEYTKQLTIRSVFAYWEAK